MARQKKIFISGKIANLIFYEFRGKECVRTMPKKVRQTKATKASALQFGKAARISRGLREGLMQVLPNVKDRRLMHRFNNVVLQSLLQNSSAKVKMPLNPADLKGFNFFEGSEFNSRWKIPVSVKWKKGVGATLNIPAFVPKKVISAPAHTRFVRLQLAITGCDLKSYLNTGSYFTSLNIPYNNGEIAEQKIVLPLEIKAGSITVVAAVLVNGLKRETELLSGAGEQWNPACVIEAFMA
jgi:hypothetical protein